MDNFDRVRTDYRKLINSIKSGSITGLTSEELDMKMVAIKKSYRNENVDYLEIPFVLDTDGFKELISNKDWVDQDICLAEIVNYPSQFDPTKEHYVKSENEHIVSKVCKDLEFFMYEEPDLLDCVERITNNCGSVVELGAAMRPIVEHGITKVKSNNGLVPGDYTIRVTTIRIIAFRFSVITAVPNSERLLQICQDNFGNPRRFTKHNVFMADSVSTAWKTNYDAYVDVKSQDVIINVERANSSNGKKTSRNKDENQQPELER